MAAPKSGPTAKKRPDERLGHPHGPAGSEDMDVVEVSGDVRPVPEDLAPDPEWHRVALSGWVAFCDSPLAPFWEHTDYVHAWTTCELIDKTIRGGMRAGQVQQLRQYMNDLAMTEGSRRAMDIAIKRVAKPDPNVVTPIERAKQRKAAGGL